MTEEYLDSKRIIGLSYSPASTDIADSAWTVTCSDYAASSGVIDWTGVRSAGVDGIHYDVGAGNISDTQWVLRFKMTTDAASGPSSGSNILHIAVSDAVVQSQSTGSEDSLGYYERYHSSSAHKQTVAYGDGSNLLNCVSDFNTTAPSTGAKYIEFKRTSATSFTVTRYSDEFVTTMETAKTVTIASTIQSLRYVKIQNKQESPASTAGTFNGTVTKVQFWNNTTSATGTPTWSSGTGSPDKDSLTNVQEGSILVEKDTANRFWGSNKVTTETVYDYTTAPSTQEKLSGTAQAYSSERAGVELVSTANDGKYIKTGKFMFKRVGTLGSNVFMKVEDSSGTVKGTSTGIAASGISNSAYEYVTFTLPTAVSLANGDRVYAEYTGTDGSGNYLEFGEKHPSTTPTGFEYTVYNKHDSGGGSPSGDWDDDGLPTTLVPTATFDSAPASDVTSDSITWTMEPTYEDDFTTDKKWVSSGAQAKVDSSGYLLFDDDSDGSAHIVYSDIGRTLDDTKWLWRFKLTTNTFSMNSDPTPQVVNIRISDNTTQRDAANEDAIGMSFRTSDGSQEYIRTTYSDGAAFGTNSNFSTDMATGTHYVQITRDSSIQFTVKLYSDSSYSTLVESNSVTIPSTITGLRYLKIDSMTSDGTSNGRITFHIDDMEVYSGVTSTN